MKKLNTVCSLTAALLLSTAATPVSAADSLIEALTNGKLGVNLRYRLETVDQDGFDEDAMASTIRGKLNYKTDSFSGIYAFAELESSFVLGPEDYNDTLNGKTQYPVVADPASTELNQAYLGYKSGDVHVKVGRQGINLGAQRYVGTVGWRQNDQTFDAITLAYKKDKLAAQYGYISNVNRILSSDHPLGDLETTTLFSKVSYAASPWAKIEGLALLVDLSTSNIGFNRANSTQTYSLRLSGSGDVGGFKAGYALEFATQSDFATANADYSMGYMNAEVSAAKSGFKAILGYEVLGSDDGTKAFATPLATLHKFNGFADKFLGTPAAGLTDIYATAIYTLPKESVLGGSKFIVTYHDFSSDFGDTHYGSEWNMVFNTKVHKKVGLNLKAAFYNADEYATDTTKFWVTLSTSF